MADDTYTQMKKTEKQIIGEHIELVRSLISRIEKKSRDEIELANLDRLRKRISLLINTMGDNALVVEMIPQMVAYSEKILARDETFFMGINARDEYIKQHKQAPSADDEFMFQLVDSVRGHYRKSAQLEKDTVYADVLKLFMSCMEYKAMDDERMSGRVPK